MLKQVNDTTEYTNVNELFNDLEFIERQLTNLKSDIMYMLRLIEASERELSYIKKETLCQR